MKRSSFLLSSALLFSPSLFSMDEVEMDVEAQSPSSSESEAGDQSEENATPDTNKEVLQRYLAILQQAPNKVVPLGLSEWGMLLGAIGWHNVDFDNELHSENRDPSDYRSLVYTHAPLLALSCINTCFYPYFPRLFRKISENCIDIAIYGIAVQQLLISEALESSEKEWEQTIGDALKVGSSTALCIKGLYDCYRIWKLTKNYLP